MWQRHQLVGLDAAAWQRVRDGDWDPQARACIELWATRRLPLVVTQQTGSTPLSLGLPAPLAFDRRRLAIQVPHDGVFAHEAFPLAMADGSSIAPPQRAAWRALCARLAEAGVAARVYGAHGWQRLTGLDYVHARSDIDLLLPVQRPEMAAAVCDELAMAEQPLARLDGELIFPDGSGVAWREWQQWREGRVHQVLVKRLSGAKLGMPTQVAAAPC